jgi:hypothetical protein
VPGHAVGVGSRFFSAPMIVRWVGRQPRQGSIVWGRCEVAARIAGWPVHSHYANAGSPASPDFLDSPGRHLECRWYMPNSVEMRGSSLRRQYPGRIACLPAATSVGTTRQRSLVAEHACARYPPHQYVPMDRAGWTARTKSDPRHYPPLCNAPGILRSILWGLLG